MMGILPGDSNPGRCSGCLDPLAEAHVLAVGLERYVQWVVESFVVVVKPEIGTQARWSVVRRSLLAHSGRVHIVYKPCCATMICLYLHPPALPCSVTTADAGGLRCSAPSTEQLLAVDVDPPVLHPPRLDMSFPKHPGLPHL